MIALPSTMGSLGCGSLSDLKASDMKGHGESHTHLPEVLQKLDREQRAGPHTGRKVQQLRACLRAAQARDDREEYCDKVEHDDHDHPAHERRELRDAQVRAREKLERDHRVRAHERVPARLVGPLLALEDILPRDPGDVEHTGDDEARDDARRPPFIVRAPVEREEERDARAHEEERADPVYPEEFLREGLTFWERNVSAGGGYGSTGLCAFGAAAEDNEGQDHGD